MASEQPEPSRTEAGAPGGRTYYGWVIVAVLFAVEFFTYATTGSTITLFFPKMMDELGWSLTQLTAAVTAAGIAGMFAAPLTGPLLDRYGARLVLAGGAVTAGVGLMLMMRQAPKRIACSAWCAVRMQSSRQIGVSSDF